ncbi:unnamed protein product [Sympodiomycopsis kandeliae]
MRVTSIAYGIKGIFPIIKKECPHAIYYPSGYSSLKGYRIAIDATLLVQRFHFSEDDHPARHVIGFHRLITSLRAADVYPIFVFDHTTSRLSLKNRENEKRRVQRGRVQQRMAIEVRRSWRLKLLNKGLERILALDQDEKIKVARLLQRWQQGERDEIEHLLDSSEQSPPSSLLASQNLRDWQAFQSRLSDLVDDDIQDSSSIPGELLQDVHPHDQAISSSIADEIDLPGVSSSIVDDAESVLDQWATIEEDQTSSVHAIASQINALHRDFKRYHTTNTTSAEVSSPSTPTQMKMNAIEEELYTSLFRGLDGKMTSNVLASMDDKVKDVQMEAETQAQSQQADEQTQQAQSQQAEKEPVQPPVSDGQPDLREEPEPSRDTREAISSITMRNESLQKSYKRSTTPLSSTIFDDCAKLCSLLKVPVLWTGSGLPYGGSKGEAEALAASLVASGQADAVATEDSDVLLAEVPLLRHLTGTKNKMELVDSLAVRRALFPVKQHADGDAQIDIVKTEDALRRADAMSRYSMLELALLCGTDFNRTIPGLAGKGALRLLREHGTIRGILRHKKYQPPDNLSWKEYGNELSRARSVFKSPPDAYKALKLNGILPYLQPIQKMVQDIPNEDHSATLTEDEEPSIVSASLQIPSPTNPSTSLIERIKTLSAASTESSSNDETSRHFPLPYLDRFEIKSFLRSKGLGKGRGASIGLLSDDDRNWRARENALQQGSLIPDEPQRQRDTSSLSFGQGVFGDDGGSWKFSWDTPSHEHQQEESSERADRSNVV